MEFTEEEIKQLKRILSIFEEEFDCMILPSKFYDIKDKLNG